MKKFSEDTTTLKEVLENEEMLAIVDKYLPDTKHNPMLGMVKNKTLIQIRALVPDPTMNAAIDKCVEELKAL